MPQTRQVSKDHPTATSPRSRNKFEFPHDRHLLITTPSKIVAWDSIGLQTIFTSSKHGIVAATEARDGSGMLAVADKHVVVLHNTKRGYEKSWGLEAEQDEVRHLQYTMDAKSLYLSTNLTTDIQQYSVETSQLLSPARTHASPPVALAVSPTGHLMVSASDEPPAIYLKNLTHNSAPTLIEPRASNAAVSVAVFHPERPNVFLLAFRDGTIAAYDATRILRTQSNLFPNQESVNAAEICHMTALHRATTNGSKRAAITDAAFLPGYKTRAISVGSDGRCRIVDFADGGVIVRTWHAKAPITSVSVLSLKSNPETRKSSAGTQAPHLIGGPTSTDNLIAVGRADGEVHLYDSVGLMLGAKAISLDGEKIISLEWVKGALPTPVASSEGLIEATPARETLDDKNASQLAVTDANSVVPRSKARKDTMYDNLGLPPALRRPKQPPHKASIGPPRRFTIHPDEIEDGTVRHTPTSKPLDQPLDQPKQPANGHYLDLFSPIKPAEGSAQQPTGKRVASPPRSRPRISSQTFVKSPEADTQVEESTVARQRNLTLFPSTASASETELPSPHTVSVRPVKQSTALRPSPLIARKRITFKSASHRNSANSGVLSASLPQPNGNAKVLADLHKMSTVHPAHRSGGVLAAYAPTEKPQPSSKSTARLAAQANTNQTTLPSTVDVEEVTPNKTKRGLFRRPVDHVETDHDSVKARKVYEHVHHQGHWPEDSNQDTSLEGDIWLTSDPTDENTEQAGRHRSHRQIQRPPARMTSRSRVNSKGTMSTTAVVEPTDAVSKFAQRLQRMDGSTEDDMYTAESHFSPSGTFSPTSNDVRQLFPRSSSLSPKKHRRRHKGSKQASPIRAKALQEVVPNAVAARPPKSPWTRAKAGKLGDKGSEQNRVFEDGPQRLRAASAIGLEAHCSVCSPTAARVRNLEGEVARLKGEVLTLKSALRRYGLALPSALRSR